MAIILDDITDIEAFFGLKQTGDNSPAKENREQADRSGENNHSEKAETRTDRPSPTFEPRGLDGATPPTQSADNSPTVASSEEPDTGQKAQVADRLPNVSDRDWNDAINTLIAEAGGEGPEGMLAVANVIKNRAEYRGNTIGEVVRAPKQFEGYFAPGPKAVEAQQNPEMRAIAGRILQGVLTGQIQDPTGGADHFHTRQIAPRWAGEMPVTAQIGEHIFYNSRPDKKRDVPLPTASDREQGEGGTQVAALDQSIGIGNNPDRRPTGRGLANLVPEPEEPTVRPAGSLSFVHPGQDKINPQFASILTDVSAEMGQGLVITSGYRSPSHPVEKRKRKPGQHAHRTAADISLRGMSDQQKFDLVQSLKARGVRRFGTYTNSPNILHVDMLEMSGSKDGFWYMHDYTNRNMAKAPAWLRAAQKTRVRHNPVQEGKPIELDENFQFQDGGFYGGKNPFEQELSSLSNEQQTEQTPEPVQQPDPIDAQLAELNEKEPGRYKAMTEDEYVTWLAERKANEPGLLQDMARMLAGGAITGTGNVIAGIGRLDAAFNAKVLNPIFGTDFRENNRWDAPAELVKKYGEDIKSGVSQSTKDLIDSSTPDGDILKPSTWTLGENPSAVGLIALGADVFGSLLPVLAAATVSGPVGAFVVGGAQGAGGAEEHARSMIDELAKEDGALERQSPYFREQLAAGKSRDEAIAATKDAAANVAALYAAPIAGAGGVATGILFNPATRILSGSSLPVRVGGRVAIGAAEEGAQEAAETVGANVGINQAIGTELDVTEGTFGDFVLGAMAGGAAGGIGGAVSRRANTDEQPIVDAGETAPENDPVAGMSEPEPVMPPQRKGPLRRSFDEAAALTDLQYVINDPDIDGSGPGENHGQTVLISANQDRVPSGMRRIIDPSGVERIIGENILMSLDEAEQNGLVPSSPQTQQYSGNRASAPAVGTPVNVRLPGGETINGVVDSYADGEVVVTDATGEVFQVPISSIEETKNSIEIQDPKQPGTVPTDALPERDAEAQDDIPAQPPVAGTTTTTQEVAPVERQTPIRFGVNAPSAGQSVIVNAPGLKRTTGKIEQYIEEDGQYQAIVREENGMTIQVPIEHLYVDGMTDAQIEAEERKKNPPVPRDDIDPSDPLIRKIGDKAVRLPDEISTRIYEVGQDRAMAKRLLGTSQLDLDQATRPAQKALSEELGISYEDAGRLGDDYRYRVQRAGREARSALPVTMHPVNPKMLERMRKRVRDDQSPDPMADDTGTPETESAPPSDQTTQIAPATQENATTAAVEPSDTGAWYDSLPIEERSRVLADAGIKRSAKAPFERLSKSIQEKIRVARADAPIDAAAVEAATHPDNPRPEPTQAQKEAGNYAKGHVRIGGLDLSIENPAGSERKGVDPDGKPWSTKMQSHYGYIKGTVGRDKDHIDVFVKPGTNELSDDAKVYVVDQKSPDSGRFDEHKVMIGFESQKEAEAAYLANYTPGWKGMGDVTETTMGDFKRWTKTGDTKKAFAPKWFGSRERAEKYVSKQGLQKTHAVVQNGKRFEIRPADVENSETAKLANNIQNQSKAAVAPIREETTSRTLLGGKLEIVHVGAKPATTEKAIEKQTGPKVAEKIDELFANNKLFTADKVAAARERLKKKLNGSQLNAGFDPELALDGMVIAGAYIEAGVRKFGAYADAMVSDFGDGIKPFLLSFYEAARNYPDLDIEGMTAVDEARAEYQSMMRTMPQEAAEVLGQEIAPPAAPSKPKKSTRVAPRDRTLTDDFGVDYIDGYGDGTREIGNDTKDAYLKNAKTYLEGVQNVLSDYGFAPHESGRRGKPLKAVSVNEAGPAVAGEVSLLLRHPETDTNVWVQVGGSSLRGVVPVTSSGISVLARIGKGQDRYGTKSTNQWMPVNVTAGDMANLLLKMAKFETTEEDIARHTLAPTGAPDGSLPELETSSRAALEAAPTDPVSAVETGGRTRQRTDARSGTDRSGDGSADAERVPARRGVSDGEGAIPVPTGRRQRAKSSRNEPDLFNAPDGSGEQSRQADAGSLSDTVNPDKRVQPDDSAATPAHNRASDFTILDEDEIGSGGPKTKFRNNIAAIRLLRKLEAENRTATHAEQKTLAKWVGWGGLQQAFIRPDGSTANGWEREANELKELLTKEEYRAAESSTRNAHYTAPEIVKAIWDIAQRLGFRGGRVLEPSVGSGNFLGLTPGPLKHRAQFTGSELDHITGGIAKHLYPAANIQAPLGFQELQIPNGYFDLAVGNPPFGNERLHDPNRKDVSRFTIHNYFFAKSVDTLKPGGVLAMVITNSFLDSGSSAARDYIAERARLVGAIRLPNNAFLANAGTEVTTDIIVLQKYLEDTPESEKDKSWTRTSTFRDAKGRDVPLNSYFLNNPKMMLGEFGAYGTMYRGDMPALIARDGDNLPELLQEAIDTLPADIIPSRTNEEIVEEAIQRELDPVAIPVGSFLIGPNGEIETRVPDLLASTRTVPRNDITGKNKERITGMVRLRDIFTQLRRAQIDPTASDASIEALRGELNRVYDAFVKEHGPINSQTNRRVFQDDPTWPQVSALETDFDKGLTKNAAAKTGETARPASAKKAPIFTRRTQEPYQRPTSAATAKDALAIVLGDLGHVDMERITELYGKSEAETVKELGDQVFLTPDGRYETADLYLSGNVKQKLARAEEAAQDDPRFDRNVQALRDIIPADIDPVDIDVKAGAPWVPASDVADFITETLEARAAQAVYSPGTARWEITVGNVSQVAEAKWGTPDVSAKQIMEAALNARTVTVTRRISSDEVRVDEAATEAANQKVESVKNEWKRWIWDDDARRDKLARLYNDTFNTHVDTVYDGSHLTFPGKVSDDVIELRPHQKAFVWRVLQSSTTLADHTVGAGKTFAAIAAVMELRRTGQAKKPMVVVPNHLVQQWAADFVKLYPAANILAATKRDFEASNRKRFFARVAAGDYDAVVVAHSSFGLIGVDPLFERSFIEMQVEDLETSIRTLEETDGKSSRSVKQLAKQREALQTRMQKLLDAGAKDTGMTFEEMGVDALVVDEAHEFKNLGFATSMTRVAGLGNKTGSKKAADLFMKVQSVMKRTGGRNIVFLTGTPISNTMAELYTMQRYLAYDALKAQGVSHFDAWARVFGEVVSEFELSASGKYKMTTRFARFVNMPELVTQYRVFADTITNDDIKRQLAEIGKTLPLPKVKGGKPQINIVPPTEYQIQYIGEATIDENGNETYPEGSIVWRSENMPKKAEKGADNMLKITSDARKAALDMRLIDPMTPDVPGTKIDLAADHIKRIYDAWHAQKGTQLVFIDLSTPKKEAEKAKAELAALIQKADAGDEAAQNRLDNMSPDEILSAESSFSVYDDLKQKLIRRGIPETEIAFIHDANTDLQKDELFGKVRSGRVRVLFGSTPKMGAGTNVQNRLVGLHHLDAPWRPSDLEQREGRIIRQGNELYAADPEGFEVEIHRYATEKTLDAKQWQTIEQKARFIGQFRAGNVNERTVEDVGGEAANAAEMKAAASGNPLILEEMELRRAIKKLENEKKEHDRAQHSTARQVRDLENEREILEKRAEAVKDDAALATEFMAADLNATIDGQKIEKQSELGEAVLNVAYDMIKTKATRRALGKIGKFNASLVESVGEAYNVVLQGAAEHEIRLAEIVNLTPAGTGARILNYIRGLTNRPELDAERLATIAKTVPRLRNQITEWPKSTELDTAREQHAAIMAVLRPKKAATPTGENETGDTIETKASVVPERTRRRGMTRDALRSAIAQGPYSEITAPLLDSGAIQIEDVGDRSVQALTRADGTIVLNPATLNRETANGVLLHEAFHSGARPLIGTRAWNALIDELSQLEERYRRSKGKARDFYNLARQRLQNAEQVVGELDQATRAEEFGAYAIEEYENAPRTARLWADKAVGHLKAWVLRRFGRQIGDVSPAQLRALAIAALRNNRTNSALDTPEASTLYSIADNGFSSLTNPNVSAAVSAVRGRVTDLTPKALALIPLNYFTELAQDTQKAVKTYLTVKRQLDAYRGHRHAKSDAVAQEWLKYNRLGKGNAVALSNLMHDATIAGYDPSLPQEPADKAKHAAIQRAYDALPEAGKKLFVKVRKSYEEQAAELDAIILDNLKKVFQIAQNKAERQYRKQLERLAKVSMSPADRRKAEQEAGDAYDAATTKAKWSMKARLTKMRMALETSRLDGPYFPLARFGDFFVTVKDITGDVLHFSMHERSGERDTVAADLRKQYPNAEVIVGVRTNSNDLRQAMDPRIIADIQAIIGKANIDSDIGAEMLDQIWQRYLQTMPDLSIRKRQIHRKKTAGYHSDALRAYASHMFHSAHQMGRLKYGVELNDLVERAAEEAQDADDPTRAGMLANELRKRHQWVMNPTGSRAAQTINTAAFVWYLAATPAAALVNLSQTPMLGIPILGSRYGMAKATAALAKASSDVVRGRGNILHDKLKSDEKAAIADFLETGLIDRTQSHDLAGVGDTGVNYTPARARVMSIISFMFHRAEVMNREVTALAAYRLARDSGARQDKAVDIAHELTWKTHFDYSNSSRPRIMQNDTAKVLLVFRSHTINMIYRLVRDVQQAVKGETHQARREAVYQLTGILGMMSLAGGVTGIFGFNLAMSVLGLVFGDDDDPFEFETKLKANIVDIFGPELGGIILNGPVGHLTGIDLTNRVGMSDIWFRSPNRDLDGKEEFQHYVMNSLGASISMAGDFWTGISKMASGDYQRGAEYMVPKAVRDMMRSYRYATEGVRNARGDEVLPADALSWWNVGSQLAGFTPAKVTESWERSSTLKKAERRIYDRRRTLMNQFAIAFEADDRHAQDDVLKKIETFNRSPHHAAVQITADTLRKSLQARRRNSALREDGALIMNKELGQQLRLGLPQRIN